MIARLIHPPCGQRLWVRITTQGGHHAEEWPAHDCREAERPPTDPQPQRRAVGPRKLVEILCERCGDPAMVKPGRARWCPECSAARFRERRARLQQKYLPMRRDQKRRRQEARA